jgi:heparosan-N-sulfate-glucuronate 5-epimerase
MKGQWLRLLVVLAVLVLVCSCSQASQQEAAHEPETTAAKPTEKPWSKVVYNERGLPMVVYRDFGEGKAFYNPVTTAHIALKRYADYKADGDVESREAFLKLASWLTEYQDPETGEFHYNFDYAVGGTDQTLTSGWSSAMAQGSAMSVLTRAYEETGEERYLRVARLATKPLEKSVSEGGLTANFLGKPNLPFYEEYPTRVPTFVLNGFMVTLIGLRDLRDADPDSNAGKLYEDGLRTLIYALPYYDLKDKSAYHLIHLTDPPTVVYEIPAYHRFHVQLLEELLETEDNLTLKYYRDLWHSYPAYADEEGFVFPY